MKKAICLVLVIVTMALLLCACGKETYTCAMCQDEVTQKPIVVELYGEEYKICNDCKKGLEALAEMFG